MNKQVLWEKIERLGQANTDVDCGVLRRFGNVLESLGDWDLLRINPIAFAEQHGHKESRPSSQRKAAFS